MWEEKECQGEGCESHFIENRKYWLCKDCNYIRIHGISRFEAILKKEKQKPKAIYKIKRKPIKTSKKRPKQKFKKSTGEYKVFLEIWEERDHICTNCKMNLDRFVDEETGNPYPMLFSHIKSKGAYPELRLVKSNVNLECMECHYAHEHIGEKAYNKRKDLYKQC